MFCTLLFWQRFRQHHQFAEHPFYLGLLQKLSPFHFQHSPWLLQFPLSWPFLLQDFEIQDLHRLLSH